MFYCVVALCVKMRYIILCIKRSLIDWLIDHNVNYNDRRLPHASLHLAPDR